MEQNHPAIVVVAFNRPKSLKRVLKSVQTAFYPSEIEIPLIISIDYSPTNKEVLEIAHDFTWKNGAKQVIQHRENLGLKEHILSCGDLSEKYGGVIVLEDDLYVSPNFYNYVVGAFKFVEYKTYVGGIALYNHKINVHTGEYFSAYEDGFDNWYFQFACSWGQAWNVKQWQQFKTWLSENPELKKSTEIPENVSSWSDKSWLKFFIAYLVHSKKYFLYPKISLSTNFNDPGTHVGQDSTAYQVELANHQKMEFDFSSLEESSAVYDAFFESETVANSFEFEKGDLEVDLYGYKPLNDKPYLLSSKQLPKKQLAQFARSLKPIECNAIQKLPGNELFLYDLRIHQENKFEQGDYQKYRRIVYSSKVLSYRKATIIFKRLIWDRIKQMFGKN
ncbi:MAG: glycosyltransferase [Bacteroidota bacterium]